MFKLVLHIVLVKLAFTSESSDILETLNLLSPSIVRAPSPKKLNLTETYFTSLDNYQVDAKSTKEVTYPWIARVIHSRTGNVPHMCTAACIEKAIFITAARCIYTLKVSYTSIMYMSKRFQARVFVVPSKPTKQMFDDIGIIVVDTKKVNITKWASVNLYPVKRTDEVFQWFTELNKPGKIKYKVVGYAVKKGMHKKNFAEKKYDLTELNVVASLKICFEVLQHHKKRKNNSYGVPCYYSCSYEEFKKNDTKCKQYHGVEGGALLDTATNKLIGIATWGVIDHTRDLPVGFATVNSENFLKDLTCARRILKNKGKHVTKGYYQKLCDGK